LNEFVKGLHHVGIPTIDMDATLSFYQSFGAKTVYEKKRRIRGPSDTCSVTQFLWRTYRMLRAAHHRKMRGRHRSLGLRGGACRRNVRTLQGEGVSAHRRLCAKDWDIYLLAKR
jgi:catechol 2,3-dioxygenase-like lactoylglutathione lyase family enzyme